MYALLDIVESMKKCIGQRVASSSKVCDVQLPLQLAHLRRVQLTYLVNELIHTYQEK